jgi:hypothetical protein
MTVVHPHSLEGAVQSIYDEANDFARAHGGVEHGMNILLGPPLPAPDLMLVSLQGAGADGIVQATWPSALLYADPALNTNPRTGRPNPFGVRLRRDFADAGLADMLRQRTVASNIIFPQSPGLDVWQASGRLAAEWNRRSRAWLVALVRLMEPRVILTYGTVAFRELTGSDKSKGQLGVGRFDGRPVIGCGHLMRGADLRERAAAIAAVREQAGR